MPRFFFDVHEGPSVLRDEIGIALESTSQAEQKAAMAAAEIARELVESGDPQAVAIDVRAGEAGPLLTVIVSVVVIRHRSH
jgi:hypothetical protein